MDHRSPAQRRETIATRLSAGGTIDAGAVAAEFGVSVDAIRRDLRMLAAAGRCRRVYGGALPLSAASTPMRTRSVEAPARKAALAIAALGSIRAGEFMFLDSGSTNLALARLLPPVDLTVVTNSVAIAAVLAERPGVSLHVIGGIVDPTVGGSVDATAIQAIGQMNFDRCFLGACALSASEGAAAFCAADAAFKRAALQRSRRVVLLATTDKLATRAPFRVAALDAIDLLVLERSAERHPEVAAVRSLGIDVVFADAPAGEAT